MFKKFGKEETKKFFKNTIEGSNFTKNLIDEYKINCDLTGDSNYEVAPHPSYFESIKEEALIYKKEFGIETKVYSKEEFNEIGHTGEEQFGALSYKPGFAINPLKFLLGLAEEAKNAGADFVGADDMVEKVKGGWTDIDVVVAAPDMMAEVGKLGKILGPRGLMPNPKIGTVTKDIAKAVTEVKAGKIEFRVEKNGIIHNSIGKVSFSKEKIVENAKVFLGAILKARPQAAKGLYMKKITMTSTMGPGIKLDRSSISG